MHPEWLSNTYLVGDRSGGQGVIIDSGGPPEPVLEAVERHGLTVDQLLLTHHHQDHVAENHVYKERLGVEILAHPLEAEELMDVDRTIEPGEELHAGELEIRPLHTPGHTAGMLSFLVSGSDVFTGDTLFKGSVGGVKAPGSTGFADLKRSVLDVLMELPPATRVHPGHTDPTTVGEEWDANAFIRVWRGLDEESDERCTVVSSGRPSSTSMTERLRSANPVDPGALTPPTEPLNRVSPVNTSLPSIRNESIPPV